MALETILGWIRLGKNGLNFVRKRLPGRNGIPAEFLADHIEKRAAMHVLAL